MEDMLIPVIAIVTLFIGLPWLDLSLHHSVEDRGHAQRFRREACWTSCTTPPAASIDRLQTIERIMTAENPNWRSHSLPEPQPRSACCLTGSSI